MINRRGFLQSILAAGIAPAVVGSGILMPVRQIWRFEELPGGYPGVSGFAPALSMASAEEYDVIRNLIGERMALVREMVMYEALQGSSIGSGLLNLK